MTSLARRSASLVAGAVLLGLVLSAQVRAGEGKKYALTPETTKIEWVGTKPGGKHEGGFAKFTGAVETAGTALKGITLEIDTGSLTSDDPRLTKHLKSPDFFDCLNFPKAKFVATRIEAGSDVAKATHTISGELTLRGKTQAIVFPATVRAGDGLSLQSSFTISKKDFGMTYGEGKIDDRVTIKVSVSAK